MNVGSLLARHARWRPDHTAVVCGEQRLSFREVAARANRLSNALLSLGLGKGDKLAVAMPNRIEVLDAYRAAAQLGMVTVPLSPLLRGPGLVGLLRDSGAAAVLSSGSMTVALDEARLAVPEIAADRWILTETADAAGYRDFDRFVTSASDAPPPAVAIVDDDIYNIIYSSGTTGQPKGIVHTHYVRAGYCTLFATAFRFTPESVVLHAGSLVFNGAFCTLMPAWLLGCTYILQQRFDAVEFIETVRRERVTHVMMVPSQIVAVMSAPNFSAEALSSLRMLCSVGAPWHREHKEKLSALLPGALYELYGLTEGFITILDSADFDAHIDSVGTPIPFGAMRIIGADGDDLPPGEVGEIVGHSPLMMPRYHNRPELTAETIVDGWLHTGDVGYADEDGYLHLVDRKKDLIISGGVNVFPKDIEEIAVTHPAVREVAVLGVPDDRWGETPVAAVILREAAAIGGDELRDWINERVAARYQRVRSVVLLDDFPRSTAGKTLKRVLRERFARESGVPETFTTVSGLRTRYLDYPGDDPPIVLLHGLSANANEFVALGAALAPAFRVVAPDLRGRGGTGKPSTGYTMGHHAADVLALLDSLGLDQVILGGHSFGAFLAIHIAVHHPERVSRVVAIDAAMKVNPKVREMLAPSLARLGQTFASEDDYLERIRTAPYMDGSWDDDMQSYFRAEIVRNDDGTVSAATSAGAIAQAMEAVLSEPWEAMVARVHQPALLINATADYGPGAGPIIPEEYARETAALLPGGRYVHVPGNHLTMVFGENARAMARAITSFVRPA